MHSGALGSGLAAGEQLPDTPPVAGQLGGDRLLVPLLTSSVPALTDQLKTARMLARTTGASLTVVNPLSDPEQPPNVYDPERTDSDDTELLEWVFDQTADTHTQVDWEFLETHNIVQGIIRAVRRHAIDTLVVPAGSGATRLRKGVTKRIAAYADADVVVVNGQAGFQEPASILLAVADVPHSGVAADVATAIAAESAAWIDVLHVINEDASERQRTRADGVVADIHQRIARPETTTKWVLEAADTADAIVEQSGYYDLTVLGAPTNGRLRRLIFDSTNASVRANANSVVLSARNNS